MLAGLRHGRTLGTPLALVVQNRDHENWAWGMSAWPPEGEPSGKGTKAVSVPRPGHADLAGTLKYGLADTRDALERASARHTAVAVAAGAVCKALLATISVQVEGRVATGGARTPDRRGARRAGHGRRRGRGACEGESRPGSARTRQGGAAGRPARRRADGHPGGQRRRDRRRLCTRRAARLAGARRDRRRGCAGRQTAPAGSRPASPTAKTSSSARR